MAAKVVKVVAREACQLAPGAARRLSTRTHTLADLTAATAVAAEETEIERKFLLDERTAERLAALPSAAPAVATQFTDAYFDTAAFALTRHDHWLRRRNAAWELKWPMSSSSSSFSSSSSSSSSSSTTTTMMSTALSPVSSAISAAAPTPGPGAGLEPAAPTAGPRAGLDLPARRPLSGIDYYTESRDWPSIAAALARLGTHLTPPYPIPPTGRALGAPEEPRLATAYLLRHGLACFATLHTARTRLAPVLTLAGGFRVHVDLDVVTYVDAAAVGATPYRIGEVELVHAADLASGLGGCTPADALAEAFAQLGISPAPVRGKVLEYLARFRPSHYAALTESGLIASKLGGGECGGTSSK